MRKRVQSMNWPLICQLAVLPRSKRNVRVIRGVTPLMSGSEIGANTPSPATAGTRGDEDGLGIEAVVGHNARR